MADNSTTGIEKNVTSADSDRLTATRQENRQPTRRRSQRSRGVTVPEETIRPLNEHHEKLEGYIKGFVLFRALCAVSMKTRSALEDPNRWKTKWLLLEEVRSDLEGIQADFQASFLTGEIWKKEFDRLLADFASGLHDAQTFLNAEDGPFYESDPVQQQTSAGIKGAINRMITNANLIEGKCRSAAPDEVDELGRYVKSIFDQLQRKPVGETSGSNKASGRPLAPQGEDAKPVVEFGRLTTEETNVVGRPAWREATNGQ